MFFFLLFSVCKSSVCKIANRIIFTSFKGFSTKFFCNLHCDNLLFFNKSDSFSFLKSKKTLRHRHRCDSKKLFVHLSVRSSVVSFLFLFMHSLSGLIFYPFFFVCLFFLSFNLEKKFELCAQVCVLERERDRDRVSEIGARREPIGGRLREWTRSRRLVTFRSGKTGWRLRRAEPMGGAVSRGTPTLWAAGSMGRHGHGTARHNGGRFTNIIIYGSKTSK